MSQERVQFVMHALMAVRWGLENLNEGSSSQNLERCGYVLILLSPKIYWLLLYETIVFLCNIFKK